MSDELFDNAVTAVRAERQRQDAKWGYGRHMGIEKWYLILAEEVGEVATAALDLGPHLDPYMPRNWESLRAELVQVAASAIAVIEAIDDGRIVT